MGESDEDMVERKKGIEREKRAKEKEWERGDGKESESRRESSQKVGREPAWAQVDISVGI